MKKQKLIIVFLIAIMMIFVNANEVKAYKKINPSVLEQNDYYCIQGGAHLKDSIEVQVRRNVTTTTNGVTTTETVTKYMTVGIKNYYKVSGIKTISSRFKSSYQKRIAAYLLSKGAGYNSSVQGVIWHHTDVFHDALGVSVTANADARSRKGDNGALFKEAKRQAKEQGASISLGSGIKQASSKTQTDGTKVGKKEELIEDYKVGATSDETNIKSDVVESFKVAASSSKSGGKATITTENYKVGPMSVKYNGTIDKVTLEYTDGSKTDKVQIEQGGKTFTDVSEINSDTKFYLINKTEKQVSKVKIHVFKKHKYQIVKYRTLKGSYTKADLPSGWKCVSGKYDSPQSLLKIEKVEEKTENTEKEFTFNLKVKKGDLELIKIGTYGIDGETKTEKLEGMKFKVYCNTLEKWVKKIETKVVTFGEFKEAQEFTTDANGVISIKGLYAAGFGNKNYVYTLVETEGNKGYYIDPIRISKTSSDIKEDQDQKIGHMQIDGKTYCTIENVTVFSKNTNKIEITDDRTSGDLVIEKRDYTIENDKSIEDKLKLQGAQFKIKLVKSEAQFDEKGGLNEKGKYIENKWLMSNDKGTDFIDLTHDKYLTEGDDPSKAGIFETDENGKIEIKGIVNGTYEIYEVKAPKGYDITKQEGYDPEKQWVNCGKVNISTKENKVTYKILNKKIITKLEGFVWIDGQPKGDKYDYIYKDGSNDKLLDLDKDIDVELRKVDGTLLATTKTVNGRYEFIQKDSGEDRNIYYWDLINSYVLFKYDNDTYIAVDPFTGEELPINSKAQEYQITAPKLNDQTIKDKKDNAYPGEAVTYKSSKTINDYKEILENNKNISSGNYSSDTLKTTPLTGYYNEDNYTVEHINLGLMPKEIPTSSVKTSLAYSKVYMNGFKYRYNYDEKLSNDGTQEVGEEVKEQSPTEQKQVTNKYYSIDKVYPSDIKAHVERKNQDLLKVYIVYRIDICNTTPKGRDPNLYEEQKMYVKDLTVSEFAKTYKNGDKIDRTYFKLDTTTDQDFDKHAKNSTYEEFVENESINQWNSIKEGTAATFNGNEDINAGIGPESSKSVYIQFKMTNDLLGDFINKKVGEEGISPFTTTLNSYHEYLRTDNVWNVEASDKKYNGAKYEKEPGTTKGKQYFVHRSKDIPNSCRNLYIKFNLPESLKKQRTISGTVFEDLVDVNKNSKNTALGNGMMEKGESKVEKVIVDLVSEPTSEAEAVTLYQLGENKNIVEAVATNNVEGTEQKGTGQNGTYEFKGVIPGYYYVRFTYGNGDQKIIPISGDEIAVQSVEYKSTIITDDNIKTAMKNGNNTEWYKYMGSTKYSTAVDDTTQRAEIEGDNEYELSQKQTAESINAYTPKTGISIENDTSLNGTGYETKQGEQGLTKEYKDIFDGFNFGIITFPKTEITPVKEITNVKLTNQVGTVMTTGNPVDEPQYISDLSKLSETGTTSAKAELDPNLIHGTQLETTYKITITNNSQYDYVTVNEDGTIANDNYYKYGETNDQELKGVKVTEVEDYIDKKYKTNVEDLKDISSKIGELQKDGTLKVTSEETNIEFKKKAPETTGDQTSESTTTENTQQNSEGSTTTTKTDTLSVKGWNRLKVGESQTVEYTAVATIASTADDLVYENQARVVSMKLDKLIELNAISENNDYWQKTDNTIITIVPNTGKDKSNTYWIAGTIALIVLGAGFVILKKKVLK